jgi:hypothetical protein
MLSLIQKSFNFLKNINQGQFDTESNFLKAYVHHSDSKADIEREIASAARAIVSEFDIDSAVAKIIGQGYISNAQPESLLNKLDILLKPEEDKKNRRADNEYMEDNYF